MHVSHGHTCVCLSSSAIQETTGYLRILRVRRLLSQRTVTSLFDDVERASVTIASRIYDNIIPSLQVLAHAPADERSVAVAVANLTAEVSRALSPSHALTIVCSKDLTLLTWDVFFYV